jgi:hypothetical protein
MEDTLSQLRLDGPRVGTVPVSRDPGRDSVSHCSSRAKEGFGRGLILPLTEEDIHQVPVSINRTVQVNLAPFHFEIMPVGRGACPWFPAGANPQPLAR